MTGRVSGCCPQLSNVLRSCGRPVTMDSYYYRTSSTHGRSRLFPFRTGVQDMSGHLSRDIPDRHTAPLGGRCPVRVQSVRCPEGESDYEDPQIENLDQDQRFLPRPGPCPGKAQVPHPRPSSPGLMRHFT